jgi:uncharacterized protein (TIGR00255 family)
MTGYGKAEKQFQNKNVSVDIKALNSKQCDINMRLPQVLRNKEIELRKQINEGLYRGKISCTISYEETDEKKAALFNKQVVTNYVNQIREIAGDLSLNFDQELLRTALQMPESLVKEDEEISKEEFQIVKKVLEEAITDLIGFRKQEGDAIKKDLSARIVLLKSYLTEISNTEEARLEKVRERLHNKLGELKENYDLDENRFEQEVVYYIEKFDITEEKVRLKNHFDYFNEILEDDNPNGKKLLFITQEIGREINTIGSKANDSGLQKIVVQMKDELEKIKEQLMNVL